jgi:hypothetical protein
MTLKIHKKLDIVSTKTEATIHTTMNPVRTATAARERDSMFEELSRVGSVETHQG